MDMDTLYRHSLEIRFVQEDEPAVSRSTPNLLSTVPVVM
jgi:hypothetical protein